MFTGTLYPKQVEAAKFLCEKRKAGLLWEQGTGKTVIAIGAIEKLRELGKAKRTLVLTLSGLTLQWQERFQQFSDTKVTAITKGNKEARKYENVPEGSICITSYALYRRDFASIHAVHWDVVVTDEAQEFKNNKSKTHELLLALNRAIEPTYRWALTGTAIATKLEELYSIMYWVDKHFLVPWPEFEKLHIVRNHNGAIWKYKNLAVLNQHLRNRVDRKTEADMAGQLPRLRRSVLTVPPSPGYLDAQTELLNILEELREELIINDGLLSGRSRGATAEIFTRCRRELMSEEKLKEGIKYVKKGLEENPENKYVFFCSLKQPLYDLYELMQDAGLTPRMYTGDQDELQKASAVQAFQKGSEVLLSSDAGATGLDLYFANNAVNLDVPFSWTKMDQRPKRVVRSGSKWSSAHALQMLMERSMEGYYYNLVGTRGELAEASYGDSKVDELVVKPQSLRQYLNELDDA